MTLTTLLMILVFGVFFYFMMKKGGGCCGGGGHDHGSHGQDTHEDHTPGKIEHHHEEHGELTTPEKDPVCGMTVDNKSLVANHKGKDYYFCSEGCKTAFDSTPEKFV